MDDKINIAAIVPYKIFPAKMGGQKGIALFYEYLSKIADVTLLGTADNVIPEAKDFDFIPVLRSERTRYADISLISKIKKLIYKRRFTHLILEHPYFGWLGVSLKKSTGIKLIVHSHNIESLRFKSTGKWWWPILWQYEKYLHKNADLNFFITDEDREFAISNFDLDSSKCVTVTYGSEVNKFPSIEEKISARKILDQRYNLNGQEKLLFFNGTLDYQPNIRAVEAILKQINPILQSSNFNYRILICGRGLPDSYNELKEFRHQHIIYAGFVDDISILFKGTDIFINPVVGGGGIKTKLVEALGYDLSVVSTSSGAIGVPQSITGYKMMVVADNDWAAFAASIKNADIVSKIPPSFFEHFYWGNIVERAKMEIIKLL